MATSSTKFDGKMQMREEGKNDEDFEHALQTKTREYNKTLRDQRN